MTMKMKSLDDTCSIAEQFINAHRNDNLLFRYRDSSRKSIKALQDSRLYFSTPKYFNDPIDSLFYVDKNQFLAEVEHEITTKMDDYVKCELESDDIIILPGNRFLLPGNKKEFLEHLLNISKEPHHRTQLIENFVSSLLKRGIALAQNNLKVICFSEDPLSTVMWSHYADNHSGFVIAYEKTSLIEAECYAKNDDLINEQELLLNKIEYSDDTVDLGGFMYHYIPTRHDLNVARRALINNTFDFPQGEVYKSLLTKMPDWAYEREWRLIPQKKDLLAPDNLKYIRVKPAAIFIGVKTQVEEKKRLIRIARKHEIPVFGMYINSAEHRFSLDCGLIEELNLSKSEPSS